MPKRKSSAKTKILKSAKTPLKRVSRQKPSASTPLVSPELASRRWYWFVVAIVIVAGIVMFVPKNFSTSTSSGSVLSHIVSYRGEDGKNALELLKAHHQVSAQQFSIGAFVTGIDGISAPPSYFWAFSVNGKPSDVGADQYITKSADTLAWQLEKIQ